jgi:hypothetical protein
MTDCQAIPVDAAVPSLKSLKSGSRYMSDAVLVAIGRRCTKLETLEIFEPAEFTSDFKVTDASLRAVLEGCPLLREIDVENARGISDGPRAKLVGRLSPSYLYLGQWSLMHDHLAQTVLKVCPGLTSLSCWGCTWLTDATLAVCAQHCPQLRKLTFPVECPVTADGL